MKKPQVIIGGVQKGGTKALIDYLSQHDKIYAYPHEIHFFSRDKTYKKGFDWYCHRFDDARPDQIAIEKSPSYIYTPHVAERIQAVLPDIKLIFILRDPVKRAYSHYWMNVRKGLERRKFAEAIRAPQQPEPETRNYVSRGFYDEQLQQFYDIFDMIASVISLASNTIQLKRYRERSVPSRDQNSIRFSYPMLSNRLCYGRQRIRRLERYGRN